MHTRFAKGSRNGSVFLFTTVFIAALIITGGSWYVFSSNSAGIPKEQTIDVPPGLTRLELAELIGRRLNWNDHAARLFAGTLAQMQWASFNAHLEAIFTERFNWNDADQEAFMTRSASYLEPQYDFLAAAYAPGSYTILRDAELPVIADQFIDRIASETNESPAAFIKSHLIGAAVENVGALIRSETELLPDLVPLPAQNVKIERVNGAIRLLFSTTYYNQGKGPFELRADPQTAGRRRDLERSVFQRIYRVDGGYRDKVAGTFLWHQEHLHYHFTDFVIYDLEVVAANSEAPDLSGFRAKSTFCIRDVSRVISLDLPNRASDANYQICGKELQGVSVGWGDTYFYNYPDQGLNISDLPSGTYRLTFIVNPSRRFDETTLDNNRSSILLKIDMKKLAVKVLEETPREYPNVEHIYPKQDCAACTL